MQELIIGVGLNENVQKSRNPSVPITPEEIAKDAKACVDAGASLLHLHIRHKPTTLEAYTEVWDALEAEGVDCPVYMGTASGKALIELDGVMTEIDAPGYDCVELLATRPGNRLEVAPSMTGSVDWLKLDEREAAPAIHLRRRLEDALGEIEAAKRLDLWMSLDIWEPGNLRVFVDLARKGMYHRPPLLKFFMTEYSSYGMPADPKYLEVFLSMLPEDIDCEWLILPRAVSDKAAAKLWAYTVTHGGHVRVGVGDNPGNDGNDFPATNVAGVERMVKLAENLGRPVATVETVRARFAPA